jgi:hypothetical protein
MAFSSVEVYTSCSPIALNCVLYTNYQLSSTATAGFYKIGTTVYQTNSSGVVINISSC